VAKDFTFYFGCASSTSRLVLRELKEPNVFISYATRSNKPWHGIENLAIDSGGYEIMKKEGEYKTSNEEYLSFVETYNPDVFVLRDYYCEPEILENHGRSVIDHLEMTTEKHKEMIELLPSYTINSEVMPVIQGWKPEQYLKHIDMMSDANVLDWSDYVGIGSLCRRGQNRRIAKIIRKVKSKLPDKRLHGFGVKVGVFSDFPDTVELLDSADSLAYDKRTGWDPYYDCGDGDMHVRQSVAYHYLSMKRKILDILSGDNHKKSKIGGVLLNHK